MSDAVPISEGPPTGAIEWRRPHPYTLLIELVSSVRDLIFPIAFILLQGSGDSETFVTEILPLIAIVLPIGTAIARYFTTRYALTDEALLHNYGIIKRNKQVLPRRNIQNLSTSAGLIARATGLQELTISDASQGGDINLRLLSVEDAESLMSLLRQESGATVAQPGEHGTVDPLNPTLADYPEPGSSLDRLAAPTSGAAAFVDDPIHELVLSDLVKFRTVTSGGPLMGIAVVIGLLIAYLTIPELSENLSWSGALFVVGPIGAGLVAAFAPVFSLGGFRLWSDPDRLRIKTGLLTEVQLNARRERLQLIRVDRHVLAQKIGLEAVQFETADVEGNTAHVNFLAPAVSSESWQRFASDALGEVELSEADLRKVSPLTKRRSLVRFAMGGITPLLALGAAIAFAEGTSRMLVIAIAVALIAGYLALAVWYANRRAERLGWAVGEDQFLFRSGVVGEQLVLVRKEKLQVLRAHQTYFQRRLGLATLQLGTAGVGLLGNVTLPDLELSVANGVLDHLAEASASTQLSRTL